jgi:hypothetical protein
MIMNKIEMYLEAMEYCSKVSVFTNRKAMKTAKTMMYLTQNSPSFTTIDSLLLHSMKTIIRKNRTRKLSEMR